MDEKWIYQTMFFNVFEMRNMDIQLNSLGKQGWEAIGISTSSTAVGVASNIFVLLKKRWTGEETDNEAGLKLKKLMQERNGS
jgi:hypothetical protein